MCLQATTGSVLFTTGFQTATLLPPAQATGKVSILSAGIVSVSSGLYQARAPLQSTPRVSTDCVGQVLPLNRDTWTENNAMLLRVLVVTDIDLFCVVHCSLAESCRTALRCVGGRPRGTRRRWDLRMRRWRSGAADTWRASTGVMSLACWFRADAHVLTGHDFSCRESRLKTGDCVEQK